MIFVIGLILGEFQNACNFGCDLSTLQSLHSMSQYDVLEEGCIGDVVGFENHTMLWLEIPKLPKVELMDIDYRIKLQQSAVDRKAVP